MGVDQNDDYSVTVNQTSYVKKLIEKFIPNHATSAINHNMPCNPTTFQKLRLAVTQAEKDKASKLPYLQLIGSLLYLSCMTRPDIAYHMSVLCSFMHNPTMECYNAALDLLLYVHSTKDLKLNFPGKCEVRRSHTGDAQPEHAIGGWGVVIHSLTTLVSRAGQVCVSFKI